MPWTPAQLAGIRENRRRRDAGVKYGYGYDAQGQKKTNDAGTGDPHYLVRDRDRMKWGARTGEGTWQRRVGPNGQLQWKALPQNKDRVKETGGGWFDAPEWANKSFQNPARKEFQDANPGGTWEQFAMQRGLKKQIAQEGMIQDPATGNWFHKDDLGPGAYQRDGRTGERIEGGPAFSGGAPSGDTGLGTDPLASAGIGGSNVSDLWDRIAGNGRYHSGEANQYSGWNPEGTQSLSDRINTTPSIPNPAMPTPTGAPVPSAYQTTPTSPVATGTGGVPISTTPAPTSYSNPTPPVAATGTGSTPSTTPARTTDSIKLSQRQQYATAPPNTASAPAYSGSAGIAQGEPPPGSPGPFAPGPSPEVSTGGYSRPAPVAKPTTPTATGTGMFRRLQARGQAAGMSRWA